MERLNSNSFRAFMIEKLKSDYDKFDGVTVKMVKTLMHDHYNKQVSEKVIIFVMNALIQSANAEGKDGYPLGINTGSVLALGDEHDMGDSKLRGIHKYWYFIT
jgi:hypothetical protein